MEQTEIIRDKTLNIPMTEDEYEVTRVEAAKQGRSMSSFIRALVARWVDEAALGAKL